MRNLPFVLAGIALLAAEACLAADTNLLPNGDFSALNTLTGWQCLGQSWISNDDADANAASGSLSLQDISFTHGYCTSPCIAVRPGAAYSLGGQSRLLYGTPYVDFSCAETNATTCNSFTYNLHGPAMSMATAWNDPAASASGILGSSTRSLKCTLTFRSVDYGIISGHFDNLFFTTDVVFAADFESP